MEQRLYLPAVHYQAMDANYDIEPIYKQVFQMDQQLTIAYISEMNRTL